MSVAQPSQPQPAAQRSGRPGPVSSYLPALVRLCVVKAGGSRGPRADSRGPRPGTEPTSCCWRTQGTATGRDHKLPQKGYTEASQPTCLRAAEGREEWKEEADAAVQHPVVGTDTVETLLHRACKRNQVETVIQILALPGTDFNVKARPSPERPGGRSQAATQCSVDTQTSARCSSMQ
ncbi:unnamed protein product, partial [Coregonus sp. 'balchen']